MARGTCWQRHRAGDRQSWGSTGGCAWHLLPLQIYNKTIKRLVAIDVNDILQNYYITFKCHILSASALNLFN